MDIHYNKAICRGRAAGHLDRLSPQHTLTVSDPSTVHAHQCLQELSVETAEQQRPSCRLSVQTDTEKSFQRRFIVVSYLAKEGWRRLRQ